eukprot:5155895-Amphidinium_carterae.1
MAVPEMLQAEEPSQGDSMECSVPHFRDEITGLVLETEKVRAARAEEMTYMKDLSVWEPVPISVPRATRAPIIGTRWLDINKGDNANPVYRSRLVAQETKRVSSISPGDVAAVFAATPPIEALRWILSRAMTRPKVKKGSGERVLCALDISRAHLHSPVRREVYITLPPEAGYGDQ